MVGVSIFEVIQDQLPISHLAGRFTELKRSGGKLSGRCPLPSHQDSNPSFFVYSDNRGHCFGCGFHGDIVDLWAAVKGLPTGIEAALDLAREYGIKLPEFEPEAKLKADERRQKESDHEQAARACHRALEKHTNIKAYLEQRGFGAELQKQFLLGANCDGSAVVFPYWHRGRVHGLVRRTLNGKPKYVNPSTDEFASGHKLLFIPNSTFGDLHWGEGYFDAFALSALGFSAISPAGTGINKFQRAELKRLSGAIYIFPDADEAGAKAANERVKKFYPRARLCPAEYGLKADGESCKDVADLFQAQGEKAKQIIEGLKSRSMDALDITLSEAPKEPALARYRYAKEKVLPLLLNLDDEGERHAAIDDVAKALRLKVTELKRALKVEAQSNEQSTKDEQDESAEPLIPQPGSERYKQAMELLSQPDLLGRAARDIEKLGHVGEHNNKKLALTCALSARAGWPIQPVTHAQSSSGKNFLWDKTLLLMPPECVVTRSALSSKALYRTKENLRSGILYIQEMAGSEDADYTIRIMQSGGCLEYEVTEKMPDGSLQNVVYKIEGPTVIVQTTTKNHLFHENATRTFPIYIDESPKQTRRIINQICDEAEGKGIDKTEYEYILRIWQDAIRLLEPAEVVIPYARRIIIPDSAVRIRRDARRLIYLIKVLMLRSKKIAL